VCRKRSFIDLTVIARSFGETLENKDRRAKFLCEVEAGGELLTKTVDPLPRVTFEMRETCFEVEEGELRS
jgi:hypothetical protein